MNLTNPNAQIEYTVEVDGQTRTDSFTTADVRDSRAATDQVVAESYAQHLSVERFENADPSTVVVTDIVEAVDTKESE